jgi:osmotically-inducible protein OsmY
MRTGTTILLGAATGAAAEYFLDPAHGRRRRHVARDRSLSFLRRGSREAVRRADYTAGVVKGAVHEATPSRGAEPELDDVALAHKVESEIFRDANAPKGAVSVNAEHGVVYLRGQVADQEWVERLAEAARNVDGVKGIKNLLHPPGTPAPSA